MENAFKTWITENYSHNEMADMANHGCAGGVGGMIYYSETEKIYLKFAHELHDILGEHQDATGEWPEYVIKELTNFPSFANAVVWFGAEWVAHEITQGEYKEEEENA
jgi:hypothetical protein